MGGGTSSSPGWVGGGGAVYPIQFWPRGGSTSSSPRWGGVPHPVLAEGGTPSDPSWGEPIQSWMGGTPSSDLGPDLDRVPPLSRPGMGYPPIQTWDGVPPCPDLGWGIPPSRPGMWYPFPCPDLEWGTPLQT